MGSHIHINVSHDNFNVFDIFNADETIFLFDKGTIFGLDVVPEV